MRRPQLLSSTKSQESLDRRNSILWQLIIRRLVTTSRCGTAMGVAIATSNASVVNKGCEGEDAD